MAPVCQPQTTTGAQCGCGRYLELVLPDTGVRAGPGLFDDPDSDSGAGCCPPAPQLLQISHAAAA
jgi:hypothetical protein